MASPAPMVTTLAAAGALQAVRVADVDGDGVDELVLASRELEVVDLAGGRVTVSLPDAPLWWDAGHGLWGVDAAGLFALDSGARVLARPTGLPGSGHTVVQTHLVVDLDRDGRVELLVPVAEAVWVTSTAGEVRAIVPMPPTVSLVSEAGIGGIARSVRVTAPALAVADLDGDGVDELLVTHGDAVSVWDVRAGARQLGRLPLPAVLREESDENAPPTAHWADVTGDARAELLVHRLRSNGRLAGTEAEVHVFPVHADRFGAPQVVRTGAGSADLYVVDFDGDGDQDVILPQLSLDAGNLAQAVLDRTVDVRLTLLRSDSGRLGSAERVGEAAVPVEDTRSAWTVFSDLDGDELPDLALAVGDTLRVYRNDGAALSRRAATTLTLPHGVTNLWPVDLTGDGAAELVGWAPGDRDVVVVRLR